MELAAFFTVGFGLKAKSVLHALPANLSIIGPSPAPTMISLRSVVASPGGNRNSLGTLIFIGPMVSWLSAKKTCPSEQTIPAATVTIFLLTILGFFGFQHSEGLRK